MSQFSMETVERAFNAFSVHSVPKYERNAPTEVTCVACGYAFWWPGVVSYDPERQLKHAVEKALEAAGVAAQEPISDEDLLKKYTSAVDDAMKAAHARDGFASNMSRESIVAGLRAVTLAAPVAVDRDRITKAVRDTLFKHEALFCTRSWEAWQHGTMTDADFSMVAEDDISISEIVGEVIAALGGGVQ